MSPSDLPLKHCAVLTPTREGVTSATRNCISELEQLGAERLDMAGCSDVALARNLLLSRALRHMPDHITTFLLVDDDMIFDRATAQLVVERAEQEGKPVSAVYPTNTLQLAAMRWENGLWLTGLGFMALPRVLLRNFVSQHKALPAMNGIEVWPFCQSAPSPDGSMWWSEDYWFSYNMGGVILARLTAKHWKRMPLFADEQTMKTLFDEPTPAATTGPEGPEGTP